MNVRWKILFTSMSMWLLGEFYLGLLGLDEFADYSQFLQDRINITTIVANSSRLYNVMT